MARRRVHLGLGSNLGARWSHLAAAIEELTGLDGGLALSSIYETAPVGGPAQGPYLNAVVAFDSAAPHRELLALAQRLERAAGRVRLERWGPRTLDVDVLLVEGETSADPEIELPHPRLYERAFVLAPLEEISPSLAPAGWREALGGEGAVAAEVRRVGTIVPKAARR
ncbi:MAG TPA: 2-amino-4-hydroxy-6-hydroxymethyldihydropteridine diphosphokinase [Acidimicrobiales bacterium]|nr:2-amino-4-hydroxy-6-hydroxymethyldihydropteridine diphosphokinase [Acidimicrobiales bacterium]